MNLVRLLRGHPISRGLRLIDDRVDPASGRFTPVGTMSHHTAGANLHVAGLQQGYSFPGPLCNVAIDTDATVHVITDGRANDSGNGSGTVLAEVRKSIAPSGDARTRGLSDTTSGNQWFYDVEVVHPGTHSRYPGAQIDALIRVLAAIHDAEGWPAERAIHHREWTRRKTDMSWRGDLRARLAEQLEDDMPSAEEVANAVWKYLDEYEDRNMQFMVRNGYRFARAGQDRDASAIADAVRDEFGDDLASEVVDALAERLGR